MSDYKIVSPVALGLGGGGRVGDTHSVAKYPIGLVVDAVDPTYGAGKFIYCRGSNIASAGQFAHIINGSAVLLASGNSALRYPVGVCPTVLSATGVYGWVQIQGQADYVRANASNATVPAGSAAYVCATDGAVSPSSVAGNCVVGLHAPVSNASGTANSAAHRYYLDGACRIHGVTALQ